jgi:L-ascorbate metabolism protein UlaG (beta-lactamase superfamily)
MRCLILSAVFLTLAGLTGSVNPRFVCAQAPGEAYTLRWFGQSFFQLETPLGKKIVFDPHAIPEFGRHAITADVILISHLHNDHAQLAVIEDHQAARIFHGLKQGPKARTPDWNPINEKVGKVHIRNLGTYHDAVNGMVRGKNSVFIVTVDNELTVCHLGDLGHELTPEQVKAIGPVDVLLVPIGGIYTINGSQARQVVAAIKPRLFVVPMHYGVPGYDDLLPADEFLDGLTNVKKLPTNELVIPATAATVETATVVLLAPPKR